MMMMRRPVVALIVLGLGAACSHGAPAQETAKQTCIRGNEIQQKATAAEAAALSGASNAQDLINELGGAVTGALKRVQHGLDISGDLQVLNGLVDHLDLDYKNDRSKVPADVAALKDVLIKFGMDCSAYLTG
jgi:hypothetical protein